MFSRIFYTVIHFIKFGFSFFRSEEPYVSDKTVLMINDDPVFCNLHGDSLTKQGFKVILAHDLESAAFQLNLFNPPIILLDHQLPDGSGIEFLGSNESALQRKQVILLTAEPAELLRVSYEKLGVFDILQKPFQPVALSKMIYLAANFS